MGQVLSVLSVELQRRILCSLDHTSVSLIHMTSKGTAPHLQVVLGGHRLRDGIVKDGVWHSCGDIEQIELPETEFTLYAPNRLVVNGKCSRVLVVGVDGGALSLFDINSGNQRQISNPFSRPDGAFYFKAFHPKRKNGQSWLFHLTGSQFAIVDRRRHFFVADTETSQIIQKLNLGWDDPHHQDRQIVDVLKFGSGEIMAATALSVVVWDPTTSAHRCYRVDEFPPFFNGITGVIEVKDARYTNPTFLAWDFTGRLFLYEIDGSNLIERGSGRTLEEAAVVQAAQLPKGGRIIVATKKMLYLWGPSFNTMPSKIALFRASIGGSSPGAVLNLRPVGEDTVALTTENCRLMTLDLSLAKEDPSRHELQTFVNQGVKFLTIHSHLHSVELARGGLFLATCYTRNSKSEYTVMMIDSDTGKHIETKIGNCKLAHDFSVFDASNNALYLLNVAEGTKLCVVRFTASRIV